tara:strand:+ start:1061 stop:1603 length:543 start_codon:yes stop_codon:yes gene_type:complete
MSRPKPNLTPAQRKAYDARMRQLRQQQQRRRRVTPKVGVLGRRLTAEQRRKLLAQQRGKVKTPQRSVASDLVRGKLTAIGNLPPEQRKKLQRDARIQRRKTVRTLREKPNKTAQEKQYLAAVKKMRQQKRRQRMINKQRQNAQNRLTKPKAPPRPTRLTGATRRQVTAALRASQKARGRG